MNHADFVSVYEKPYDTQTVKRVLGPYYEPMGNAISKSCDFGAALYDHLESGRSTSLTERDLETHASWVTHKGSVLEATLSSEENHTNSEALNALTIYGFHPSNVAMSPMWTPVINGGWQSERQRQSMIRVSQGALALEGLKLFQSKLHLMRQMQSRGENYFGVKYDEFRAYLEGRLNEIDAGVILLSVTARMPGSSVVPGPLQFEQNSRRGHRYNADYVLLTPTSATGVQIKSQVLHADEVDYDESRVVLVDCATDLANESRQRIDPHASRRLRVPWGGLISAHHVLGLQTARNGARDLVRIGRSPREIVQAQWAARSAIAGMKSMNTQGVKIIEDRIERALAQNRQNSRPSHAPSRSAHRTIPPARQAGQLAIGPVIGRQTQYETLQES